MGCVFSDGGREVGVDEGIDSWILIVRLRGRNKFRERVLLVSVRWGLDGEMRMTLMSGEVKCARNKGFCTVKARLTESGKLAWVFTMNDVLWGSSYTASGDEGVGEICGAEGHGV